MKKKRLILLSSLVLVLLLLTGCSSPEEQPLITLDTTFKDMFNEGIFSAILTYPLSQSINFLSEHVGVGLAMTVVTFVLNTLIVVFTFKSNIALQKMNELQPELQKIQMKYEGRQDDVSQQRMAFEMQELYKKYDINPVGTLVASFIQLPVLIAMYSAVRRSDAVAHGTFLGVSLETTPAQAFRSFQIIIIVIYIVMIALQFLSIMLPKWLANAHGKAEADRHHKHYDKPQDNNAAMSYGIILMVAVLMLTWPAAMSLYYCISSLVTIVKTVVVDAITHNNKESR